MDIQTTETIRIGNESYQVMACLPIGRRMTDADTHEEFILSLEQQAMAMGCKWVMEKAAGVIYWIPQPEADIAGEIKRLKHAIAEWQGRYEDQFARIYAKMGMLVFTTAQKAGFDCWVLVESYPKDGIRLVTAEEMKNGE